MFRYPNDVPAPPHRHATPPDPPPSSRRRSGLRPRRPGPWTALLAAVAAGTGLAAVSAPSLAGQAGPARSQAEIARDLRSHDRDTVARALGEVPLGYDPDDLLGWRFPPGYVVTPELSAALIGALDREARLHMDGCTVTGFEGSRNLELSLELEHYVIALRDPATIPALVQMICSGGAVRQALLEFGPAIVPHVVEWARSPEAARADVTGALLALSVAAERWGDAMPAEMRASIRDVAMLHLGPPQERFVEPWDGRYVLQRAITLASVMRDPGLLSALDHIAEEGHEALDDLDPEVAEGLRDMARRGLAAPRSGRADPLTASSPDEAALGGA